MAAIIGQREGSDLYVYAIPNALRLRYEPKSNSVPIRMAVGFAYG